MARLAARSLECRRILRLIATAGRPLTAVPGGRVGRRVRGRAAPGPPRGRHPARATATACSARTCSPVGSRRSSTGSSSRAEGTIAMRHESIGRAVERDLLPETSARYHAALAVGLGGPPSAVARHWLVTHDPRPARVRRDRGSRASPRRATPRRTSWPRSSSPCRSPRIATPAWSGRGRIDRSGTGSGSRSARRRRRSRLVGCRGRRPISRSPSVPSMPAAIASGSGCSTSGWPMSAAPPATRSARWPRRVAPSSSSHARPAPARARVLAALAQLTMLEGIFSDAQRIAHEAIEVARACEPVARQHEVHALTTLGVAMAWGSDPSAAIELLRDAERAARELDDQDALFRVRANLTTVLDLVARRTEAVDVAYEGIAEARRTGLEAVYGNFLAGQRRRVAVPPGPLARGPRAEHAGARVAAGRRRLPDLDHPARDRRDRDGGRRGGRPAARADGPRVRCPARAAAGRLVLPRRRVLLVVERRHRRCQPVGGAWLGGRPRDRGVGPRRAARGDGRPGRCGRRDRGARASGSWRRSPPRVSGPSDVVRIAAELVRLGGAPATAGSRQVAEAYLATARAYQRRLEGDDDPEVWATRRRGLVRAIRARTRWPSPAGVRPKRRSDPVPGDPVGPTRGSHCSRP